MHRVIAFVFILISAQLCSQFHTPIEGTYGNEYIIVNYVDWGLSTSIKDHQCGSKSYDGHQGTDYVIRSFPLMDSGIYVLAVDTGIVTALQDGLFDRNMVSIPSLRLGNYIALKHSGLLYTYYGHLKKNSLLVAVGDTVMPGQRIAKIGSSGNSTDPHLHLELWYDSSYVIDPYNGPCGNLTSYWNSSIPYDTTFKVWESGLINFVPTIDSLRERGTPRIYFNSSDNHVTYWNLKYGLKNGDSTTIEWYQPDGTLYSDFTNYYVKDWHFYYYHSNIIRPAMSLSGKWNYKYYHNNSEVDTGHFYLGQNLSLNKNTTPETKYKRLSNSKIEVILPENYLGKSVSIYSINGQLISKQNIENSTSFIVELPVRNYVQIYMLKIEHSNGVSILKIIN